MPQVHDTQYIYPVIFGYDSPEYNTVEARSANTRVTVVMMLYIALSEWYMSGYKVSDVRRSGYIYQYVCLSTVRD